MGRRNINTTKSGKYMNPTDQARKEARKRELKKNKKQRQMVRAAVLKGKDPSQIIMEMEKIDNMEYNVDVPPALSEKVLKDKRKKLRETLDRVLKLYERENPEYWVEIRRMEGDYEKKRLALIEYFESVRHAQAVTIDEIPLPNLEMPSCAAEDMDGTSIVKEVPQTTTVETQQQQQQQQQQVPVVPNAHLVPAHGILKKLSAYVGAKVPPGCPPTLPPDLSDEEFEDELEDMVVEEEVRPRTIRFEEDSSETGDKETARSTTKGLTSLQTKLLQMSGQDIDDFMRETEVLFREKAAERKADLRARLDKIDDPTPTPTPTPAPTPTQLTMTPQTANQAPQNTQQHAVLPPPPHTHTPTQTQTPTHTHTPIPPNLTMPPPIQGPPPTVPTPVNPPANPQAIQIPPPPPQTNPLLFRLPMQSRLGPPPGIRAGTPLQGLPRMPNIRMPPPMPPRPIRPPGIPPGLPPPGIPPRGLPPMHNPNVLTAGPQLIPRPREEEKKHSATIEAKPQIRSLSADVTRFLPTALRVKREDKKKTGKAQTDVKEMGGGGGVGGKAEETDRKPTKDDAYSQFMREMEGLL